LRQLRLLLHFLRRSPHEPEFHFLSAPGFRHALLLDLGANIGQSAVSALKAQSTLTVISVEANPSCQGPLKLARRLLGARFDFRIVGVGSRPEVLKFLVPLRSSRMLLEEGTFDRRTLSTPATQRRIGLENVDYIIREMDIPVVTIDSLRVSPAAVKMDLQGFELSALHGMTDTIKRSRPFIMVEVGEDLAAIDAFLTGFGYEMTLWNGHELQKTLNAPGALNVIFRPSGLSPREFRPSPAPDIPETPARSSS